MNIKTELAYWIHCHTDLLTAQVQRLSLREIAVEFGELLKKSPYVIYQDCMREYTIFKRP